MNYFLRLTLLLGSTVLLFLQACDTESGGEKLSGLYDEIQQFEEQNRPDDDKGRLQVHSLSTLEKEYNFRKKKLEQVRTIDRESLSFDEKISYDLFERDLEHDIKAYEFKRYLVPINHEGGFHTRLVGMQNGPELDSLNDYKNYINRLRSFQDYFDEYMHRMRMGMEQGYVLPKAVLPEGYNVTITSQITDDPTESGFYEPFTDFPETVPEDQRRELQKEGKAAINKVVVPAYQSFLDFLKNEYIPNARDDIAISAQPGGEDYYRHLVNYYTTLDVTPDEVHQIGLDEVERIRGEMEQVIEDVNFDGTFQEFLAFLRTDPQFYVDEPEELLEAGAMIAKRMDGKLPELFNRLPRKPYGIEPVPAHLAPRYTGGRYSPSRGKNDAGNYWINTYAVETRPLYVLEALTFHEAVPGHHLQIALANELENVSEIRQHSGVTAFVEGWALYSERLGLEAGFYQDPYSNFGRLTYEMWRACRLVVDTGMHALGWTRQQAVGFMTQNTALSHHEIDTEINRYIAVPAQALAYKMGELKIRALRQKAEKELGPKFNIGEFHDAVLLNGAVPLPILEEQIEYYINQEM